MSASNIKFLSFNADDFVWDTAKEGMVAVRWLGQAGFQIFYKNYHLMIDPYLSNHLARKYSGSEFPHIRMMASSLIASKVKDLDIILCTHRHSDHMDPDAIPVLLDNNNRCKIIAPKAEREYVLNSIIADRKRIIFVNADDKINLSNDIIVEIIPSAHEELKTDKDGNHHCLGYILRLGEISIYHSGDCVPYAGLTEEIKKRKIDMAMLPVNGRDEYRRSRGVPGNFTFEESVELCKAAKIPIMVCHHFGMFEFNTIQIEELNGKVKDLALDNFQCIVP